MDVHDCGGKDEKEYRSRKQLVTLCLKLGSRRVDRKWVML